MLRPQDGQFEMRIDNREITKRFVRAMGTDGQNANRAATAVQLRLDINASSLPPEVKDRLLARGGRHVTRDGVLIVASREYRSQARNRMAARQMPAELVKAAERGEEASPLRLTDADVQEALRELVAFGGELTQKLLGYRPARIGYAATG